MLSVYDGPAILSKLIFFLTFPHTPPFQRINITLSLSIITALLTSSNLLEGHVRKMLERITCPVSVQQHAKPKRKLKYIFLRLLAVLCSPHLNSLICSCALAQLMCYTIILRLAYNKPCLCGLVLLINLNSFGRN